MVPASETEMARRSQYREAEVPKNQLQEFIWPGALTKSIGLRVFAPRQFRRAKCHGSPFPIRD